MKRDPQPHFESDSQPHFTHKPFPDASNSIRLLQLHPGRSDEPLKTSLQIFSLEDRPEYDALSYMWGPKEPRHSIQVDNQSFLLRPNIYDFLLRLRFADRPRRLWLDAICIDQNNIEERGYQVSLMRDIYQRCRECLAWLGESKDRGDEVIEVFKRSPVDALGTVDLNNLVGQLYHCRLTEAFKGILSHPYWSRVWMIQETTLPDKVIVHCGGSSCLLDNLPTQVRGRMFEIFQQDPVRYRGWLRLFRLSDEMADVIKIPVDGSRVQGRSSNNSGLPCEFFPCLVGYARRARQQECFLGFTRSEGDTVWEAVVVEELEELPTSETELDMENESGSSLHSAFSIIDRVSLSTVTAQYFSVEAFDPGDAFRAVEAVFWCIKNSRSEQLLDERRRHSTVNHDSFSSVEFRKFLETADRWYCTDIRDRVFGSLGVFRIFPRSHAFRADYRLSVRGLLLELVDYCQPTDPFKLAIRLSSALHVDIYDYKGKHPSTSLNTMTVMSRIAWPLSSFDAAGKPGPSEGSDRHCVWWLHRSDVPPPAQVLLYLTRPGDRPGTSDELVSAGDAGIVIGVRTVPNRHLPDQPEFKCVGIGFDMGSEAHATQTNLEEAAHRMLAQPVDGSDDDIDRVDFGNSRASVFLEQVQSLQYLPQIQIQKAHLSEKGADGTPVLWWLRLPIDFFWYICQHETRRRATPGSEQEADEEIDSAVSSDVRDEGLSSRHLSYMDGSHSQTDEPA